ncbi:MAG TPA: hypothetical protein VLJ41_11455 [Segetibacter sp.]|nr:hypothetical protein [Segetibacter sp.]
MMRCIVMTLFFAATSFFYSCEKDNRNATKLVEGEWELVRITGSRPVITFDRGNGNVLKFTNTNYDLFENNRLKKSGTYTIQEEGSAQSSVCLVLPPEKYRNRIIYDNDDTPPKTFLEVSNDTLSFISGCFATDAGTKTEYVRR